MTVHTKYSSTANTDTLTKLDLNTKISMHCHNTFQFRQRTGESLSSLPNIQTVRKTKRT